MYMDSTMAAWALLILGWLLGLATAVVLGSIAKGCEDDASITKPLDEDTIRQMREMNDKGYCKPGGSVYGVTEDGEWDWLGDPDGWKNR